MALGGKGGPCRPNRSGLLSKEPEFEETADDESTLVCASLGLVPKVLVIEVNRGNEPLNSDGPLLRREPPLACRGVFCPDRRRTWA